MIWKLHFRNGHSGRQRFLTSLKWISLILILLVVIIIFGLAISQRYSASGPFRIDFEGVVVGKSITFRETETGSLMIRRLLIKGRNNETFSVIVGSETYERAEIGKFIKSNPDDTVAPWESTK